MRGADCFDSWVDGRDALDELPIGGDRDSWVEELLCTILDVEDKDGGSMLYTYITLMTDLQRAAPSRAPSELPHRLKRAAKINLIAFRFPKFHNTDSVRRNFCHGVL